eukprot:jgi/Botrbrau1/2535/Bobra.0079s0023.1
MLNAGDDSTLLELGTVLRDQGGNQSIEDCPASTPLLEEAEAASLYTPETLEGFVPPPRPSGSDKGVTSPFATYASDSVAADVERARMALYASHALATWGQRMWEFAVGLVMLELQPSSLQLVAVCGLLGSAARFLAGGAVGRYVDRTERYKAACTAYVLQNAAIAVSASAAWLALGSRGTPALLWLFTSVAILASAVSGVGCMASLVSVEREWTKTLSQGDSEMLASLNSGMKAIDLVCLIASPLVAGVLMTWAGTGTAVAVILLWNAAAWIPECYLLQLAQSRCSSLRQPPLVPTGTGDAPQSLSTWVSGLLGHLHRVASFRASASDDAEEPEEAIAHRESAWAVYLRQSAVRVALADALLYLTVMSGGLLMTAYLKWLGLSEAGLALWRGFAALAGVAATYIFPPLRRYKGLDVSGLVGIWFQVGCLLLAVLPATLAKLGAPVASSAVAVVLMAGVALSRFGLWTFDLVSAQVLQERVLPHELGVVNGVQASMQSLLTGLSFLAGLLVWRTDDFVYLMQASCAVIGLSALTFTSYALPRLPHRPSGADCALGAIDSA